MNLPEPKLLAQLRDATAVAKTKHRHEVKITPESVRELLEYVDALRPPAPEGLISTAERPTQVLRAAQLAAASLYGEKFALALVIAYKNGEKETKVDTGTNVGDGDTRKLYLYGVDIMDKNLAL